MAFTLRDNKYFGKPKAEMTVTSEGLRPGKAVTSPSVPLAESVALMMCVFTTTRMSVSLSPRSHAGFTLSRLGTVLSAGALPRRLTCAAPPRPTQAEGNFQTAKLLAEP